ncbi:MAG: bifunctional precorrin-2 dehydrogenase/sirohydrochlorin ferrochelatase [Thermodesulfovibrionales bacterium]
MKYYPVFLNVQDKKAVIVGGGKVAERKALALIKAGAFVTVVSPDISEQLVRLREQKRLQHIPRLYQKRDISRAFVVIAATDSSEINSRISRDAGGLVNVVDVPPLCNFIAPSVIQRGPLTLAISTSGASPAFAKTIRKELEKLYGPEIGGYLKFLNGIRTRALAAIPEQSTREKFLKGLASEKMLQMLRTKGIQEVKKAVQGKLDKILNQS